MRFIDLLSLILSFLGIEGLIFSLRYLIPCYFIPFLSAHLNATRQLLNDAEALNAIQPESKYRALLDFSANQFAEMRVESNLAWWPFQQLRLAIQRGLTCRLYALYYRLEGMKSNLELAIDQQQLRITEVIAKTAVPGLELEAGISVTATPANDVVDPTLPLPVTSP